MNPKEGCIETIRIRQDATGRYVVAAIPQSLCVEARLGEFSIGKEGDRFSSLHEIYPEFLDIVGARESAGHPNNCDAVVLWLVAHELIS
jgi:hypothetical protein